MRESEFVKNKPICYVDMDGVLADLFAHATNVNKVKHWLDLTKAQWEEYYSGVDAYDLFSNLDPFPTSNGLVEMVTHMFGSYQILSRPLEFNTKDCIAGKNKWIDTHLTIKPVERHFTPDKWKYATQADGTPNILIDDHRQNVHLWNEHGGIGIKWQADENNLAELKHMLNRAKDKFQ